MIAHIIVDQRGKMVDKFFDYLVPPGLEDKVQTGSRVIVPFSSGNKEIEGFCMGTSDSGTERKLKSLIRLVEEKPVFDRNMLELIEYMREHYLCGYLDIIRSVVPPGTDTKTSEWLVIGGKEETVASQTRRGILKAVEDNGGGIERSALCTMFEGNINSTVRSMIKSGVLKQEFRSSREITDKKLRAVKLAITPERALAEAGRILKKAPVQARILDVLSANDFVVLTDLIKLVNGSYNAVIALKKKGMVRDVSITVERDPFYNKEIKPDTAKTPTEEQKNAICTINEAVENGIYRTFLLHGVTGSGKTEVFMQVIQNALDHGKTALVLVPEISLTPQMVARFRARFGERTAVFHSALSMGERYDQWKKIQAGRADIVIGARSAVFTPLKNIGVIIMDEEHSDTYKSEMSPRYHAKEVASFRARQYGAALVLASATPSVESYYLAQKGDYTLITMKNRYNNNAMPDISVVDMRKELESGNRSMFSRQLINELENNIEYKEQTILFLNRRGFSTFVSCRSCGYTAKCPNCNISLTYHKYGDILKCHYCGYMTPNYRSCPSCGSRYIRYFGGGTQKVEEETKKFFPSCGVVRMDVDTTGKKQSHEILLETFDKEKKDVLIGTQMVAKGLDFENVTLVGVVSADTMLNINDYRSAERTFAMLEQVTGRAGRGSKKGRAIIQTYSPDADAVRLVKEHDYRAFYRSEISVRKLMWYPPFSKMISVLFSGRSETLVPQAARFFLKHLGDIRKINQRLQILGPVAAAVSKIKNRYRWQIIIKCEDDDGLNKLLSAAAVSCAEHENYRNVSVVIDKNPNMM